MGRNSLLNEELRDQIVDRLRLGVPVRWACEGVGISHGTHYNWCARGEEWSNAETDEEIPESERIYVEYLDATRKAIGLGRGRYAMELFNLATNPLVDEAVRLRATIFFLTHGDRDEWHTDEKTRTPEADNAEVQIEW